MPTGPRERAEEKEMSTCFLMFITEWTGGINRNPSVLKVGKSRETVMEQLPQKYLFSKEFALSKSWTIPLGFYELVEMGASALN